MKVAIVTGGAQGIGKQTAMSLISKNYRVILADSDEEAGLETRNELQKKGAIDFLPCDVSREVDVISVINHISSHYNRLDVLVNNAAVAENKPILALSLEEWNKVISINLTGAFLFSKYASPLLRENQGVIINLCSTRAFMSEKNTEAYSASKGGIFALTHALAMSLGPEVRVNCISPGWIEVSGLKKSSQRDIYSVTEEDHKQHPAGRVGKAEDISSLILYLISEESSFITGQNFFVDGGMTRKMIYV